MHRLILPLCLVACASGPTRDGDGWTEGPALPVAIQEHHAAVLDGSIYVAGGIAAGNAVTVWAHRLDPGASAWTRIADLPAPRHHMPLAAAGDSLYAIGGFGPAGFQPVATFWVYDVAGDRWLARPPLPEPRGASAAAVVGGRIVVVGGAGTGNALLDSTLIYDPAAGRWFRAAPIPTPRDHLAAAAVGGAVYAIGGRPLDPDRNFDVVERFDPATGTWTAAPPMPTARGGLAAAALGGAIHVFGGETSRRVFEEHEVLDLAAGRWEERAPLPTARHGLAAAAVGGRIFVIGGGPRAGLAQTAVVEVFAP